MLYLLDANVRITASNLYYPLEAVPEFWDRLAHQGAEGAIKMPIGTYEEVRDGSNDAERDLLFAWVQDVANRQAILFDEDVDSGLVRRVLEEGYRGADIAPGRAAAPRHRAPCGSWWQRLCQQRAVRPGARFRAP